MKVCFDIDFILYECAAVCETRYIIATHIPTGEKMEFENKTELWGDWRKKTGGWIGKQNEEAGEIIYLADEFIVQDGQRLRQLQFDGKVVKPINGAKRLFDGRIKEICDKLDAKEYFGFTGEGDVFRHEVATLMPYKGNREDMLRPLLLKELKEYAIEKHNIKLVTKIEADDAVAMAVHQGYDRWKKGGKKDKDKIIGVAVDKDSKGVQGFWFNPEKDEKPREVKGFGKLFLNAKDEVDGYGRMWLYYQICNGDAADNYKANCMSKVRWGDKAAYTALKDCTNDKEAWEALVASYKKMYPEPKEVQTFRGDVITIDWMYVLQEMTTLAFMLREENDKIVVKDVLKRLEIAHE